MKIRIIQEILELSKRDIDMSRFSDLALTDCDRAAYRSGYIKAIADIINMIEKINEN